jgi:hypothetical protein
MNGTMLRETLQDILHPGLIRELCDRHQVIERERKLDIVALVQALVLSASSDDYGRLADAHRQYGDDTGNTVVRGAFYKWIDESLAALCMDLLAIAIAKAKGQPVVLRGLLRGVQDWLIVDSETVTLRASAALKARFAATHEGAGLKVHKEYSVGRGCLVSYRVSPAREHDAKRFRVEERLRGHGILIDLAYASLRMLQDCVEHGVQSIVRLKENWQPQITRLDEGTLRAEFFEGMNFRFAVKVKWIELDGTPIDAQVRLGKGRRTVRARLVGVSAPDGYHFYLTTLPCETHSPQEISDLYRVRWEIEGDNKLDKTGCRIDQVQASRVCSAEVLIYAALLRSVVVNSLVHRDRLAQAQTAAPPRAPLHRLIVARVLDAKAESLISLLRGPASVGRWDALARYFECHGRDPNWRGRPSILDRMLGQCAPAGRARRKRMAECPATARPYRTKTRLPLAA